MSERQSNEFEAKARCRKALAIADVLTQHHATPEVAAELSQEHRDNVAELAGVRPPSETTWALVVTILEHRASKADPLVGLGA